MSNHIKLLAIVIIQLKLITFLTLNNLMMITITMPFFEILKLFTFHSPLKIPLRFLDRVPLLLLCTRRKPPPFLYRSILLALVIRVRWHASGFSCCFYALFISRRDIFVLLCEQ